MRAWALFLVGACAAAAPLRADAIRSNQEDLRRVKREISRKTRERRQADEKAQELEQEVSRISTELKSSRRAMKDAEKKIRDTERKRAEAEDRLWASRLDLKQRRRALAEDYQRFYVRSAVGGDSRFLELALRRRIILDKTSMVSAATVQHEDIRASHEELVSLKAEFETLRGERETEADRVHEARKKMTSLLKTVQGRRSVLQNEIEDLNVSAQKFEALIQKLIEDRMTREAAAAKAAEDAERTKPKRRLRALARQARRRPAAAEAADFGKLPWPIEGTVVARFGKFKHPELDTPVVSNGIKIRPAQAGPVRAVAGGEVLYAGEFMGYGPMALVAHPDNLFTIYAHMGELRVKKGKRVSAGEVLGTSGTDEDDRPVVYFELRLHGEAMDPLLWLK